MTTDTSLWHFIIHAGFIVKSVLIILLCTSIMSWTMILQRFNLFREQRKKARQFTEHFWSGIDLQQLHQQFARNPSSLNGLAKIFYAGMDEFNQCNQNGLQPAETLENVQRSMRYTETREADRLERNLSWLATIGSTSPYIGLFGTVWGIMSSFQALGSVQQATIAMVAPGISEALIATAIGLFAAIPAVISYNRFSTQLETLRNQYETFQEEFISLLHRQLYATNSSEE